MPFCMACSRIFGVASPPVSIVGDAEVQDQALAVDAGTERASSEGALYQYRVERRRRQACGDIRRRWG